MFKETVEVVQVLEGEVKIKFAKRQSCSSCKASHICGQDKETLILDKGKLDLQPGDKVEVEIDERKTILANLITLFIPAIIFIGGLIFFQGQGEILSFLLAISSVCIYYVIVKKILKAKGKHFKIKILGKA